MLNEIPDLEEELRRAGLTHLLAVSGSNVAIVLGVVALALATLGTYGVISFSVSQRTREIGIRMALGSTAAQAIRAVTVPGIVLTLVGLGLGALLARAATKYIATLLWGVQPNDPLTFALRGGPRDMVVTSRGRVVGMLWRTHLLHAPHQLSHLVTVLLLLIVEEGAERCAVV